MFFIKKIMPNKKCKHCGAELPVENEKDREMPKSKFKQIFSLKCPECGKENKIIYYPSPPPLENKGKLRMFLLLG
jgi:rRNA maturation protein Nop10|tara:strand:+ start:46 stop:270 length:225 start_codon:yes stop_codon:yes gene_type:complete